MAVGQPGRATSPVAQDVTVLDWNIKSAQIGGAAAVAADIATAHPDVVVLEEVSSSPWGGDNARELADRLGMYWAWLPNSEFGGHHFLGNAVLSRYPISQVYNTPLPYAPGTEPRGLLHTLVDVNGVKVTVWATHLHFTGPVRLPQSQAVSDKVGDPSCATVLAGDMNSTPNSPMYSHFVRHLVDSFAGLTQGSGATVPADVPRGRIDYIFHSADISASQQSVRPQQHSDHRAVRVVLHVDPSSSC